MVKSGEIACPKCGEDRETLITPVVDPMGKRWFCSVCAHEFTVPKVTFDRPRRQGVIVAILLLAGAVGCSSMTERIVHEAQKGLVWEADYTPGTGGNPEALAALHAHFTQTLKIDIEFLPADDPILHGAFGVSYASEEAAFIKLRQDLSVNATIEVLSHEGAHLFQPPYLTRSQGDVFAEIVSAHVASRLGVPHSVQTSGLWLRQHKPSLRTALDLQKEIQYVANKLTPGQGAGLPTGRE